MKLSELIFLVLAILLELIQADDGCLSPVLCVSDGKIRPGWENLQRTLQVETVKGEKDGSTNITETETMRAAIEKLEGQNSDLSQQLQEIGNKFEEQNVEINDLKNLLKKTRCFMGMKNGDIPDSALSASSSYAFTLSVERARLDTKREGAMAGAWCPKLNGLQPWYQVDLGRVLSVAGIIMQRRPDLYQFVKKFKVKYGDTTDALKYIMSNGTEKIFEGNSNAKPEIVHKFPSKLSFRFIQIYPRGYEGNRCMRFELIRGACFDEY